MTPAARLASRFALTPRRSASGVVAALLVAALPVCALLVTATLAGCALEGDEAFGGASEEIAGGMRETGYPSVVFLYNRAVGSACTAAIIAPRVVLTAKHCVRNGSRNSASPASQFEIYVASSARVYTAMYLAAEVRTAPGSWDIEDGSDVAVLILTTPASETPYAYSRERPNRLTGASVTAVGFGELPDGSSGTKYRVTTTVEFVMENFVFVDPSVCSGDSGGPLLDADGVIHGVASFIYSPDGRTSPRCGTAPGAYSALYPYLDFIDLAVTDSGSCIASGAEICDGVDNDCNELVDEGCTPIGSACVSNDTCVGGLCEMTSAGQICTRACDPVTPYLGCPPSLYCSAAAGCDGRCVPGVAGATPYDAECSVDTDCGTLVCKDPGDGRRRCLAPCRGDAGSCVTGEACAAAAGGCGVCVPAAILVSTRGLGEPCTADAECLSGQCLTDTGLLYCTRACSDDAACGAGFRCFADRLCHRAAAEPTGGPCRTDEHCMPPGACAARGSEHWCTVTCATTAECPTGFTCDPVSPTLSVCAPALALSGAPCVMNEDCTSGLCELGSGVCTRFCDADSPCGPGDSCDRIGDGTSGICLPPASATVEDDGGCGCRAAPSGRMGFGAIGASMIVALFAVARRRARRR